MRRHPQTLRVVAYCFLCDRTLHQNGQPVLARPEHREGVCTDCQGRAWVTPGMPTGTVR